MVQTPSKITAEHFISKGYLWSLYIFGLTLPVRPFFLENILSYSTILFLIFALAKIFYNRDFEIRGTLKHLLLFGSLFVWWAVSLIYSSNLSLGLKYMETKLALILIPTFILIIKPVSNFHFKRILKIYAIGVTSFLLLSYFLVIVQNYNYNQFKHIVYPFYMYHSLVHFIGMHATYMAIQVALSIFIVLNIILSDTTRLNRQLIHIIWLAFLIFALLSLTVKMISLAFMIALIGYTSLKLGLKRSAIVILPILLISLISIGILSDHNWFKKRFGMGNKEFIEDLNRDPENKKGTWGSVNMRYGIAKSVWPLIKENFLFGTGIGDEKAERRQAYEKNNFQFALNRDFNEHNQYLNVWLNSGIIGLILLLTLLIIPLIVAIKKRNALYLAFIILIAVSFLSENYLSRQIGVAFFAFFHVFFWTNMQLKNQTIHRNSV